MSEVQRTKPVILITDDSDTPITEFDFGEVAMTGDSLTFRVWNNKQNFKAIPSAVNVKLIVKASPKPSHSLITSDDQIFRGRCTYSAKQSSSYNENLQPFPLNNTDYDEIGSGEYNEYEVVLSSGHLDDHEKERLNGNNVKIYIIVENDRGVVA